MESVNSKPLSLVLVINFFTFSCRFHMAGDHGPLTCSHLESYDPDRALTDYISRLEALQRRLGSVTSGNTDSGFTGSFSIQVSHSVTSLGLPGFSVEEVVVAFFPAVF